MRQCFRGAAQPSILHSYQPCAVPQSWANKKSHLHHVAEGAPHGLVARSTGGCQLWQLRAPRSLLRRPPRGPPGRPLPRLLRLLLLCAALPSGSKAASGELLSVRSGRSGGGAVKNGRWEVAQALRREQDNCIGGSSSPS